VQGRPVEQAAANLAGMLHRARHMRLRVAIADVLPWNNGDSRAAADIDKLNELIRSIAEGQDVPLLRFNETLADPSRPTRMRETLTEDGDHPSVEGHRLLGERAFHPF